jgi:MoxR-like ATPase
MHALPGLRDTDGGHIYQAPSEDPSDEEQGQRVSTSDRRGPRAGVTATLPDEREAEDFARRAEAIVANVEQVIRGKTEVVRLALCCMVADGHLLVEDVPGVGKTSLGKALAESIGGTWNRIQFTPDLLPTDVTGVQIYNRRSNEFEFRPGSVFANVVLADEINRASPKTQSALLEVMAEYQVTVDSHTYPVPNPFLVIATQNPIEHEGTYNLPEAQIDRFLMRVSVGYPDRESEVEIIDRAASRRRPVKLAPVVSTHEIAEMSCFVEQTYISPAIKQYIVAIARATRELPQLRLGVSPRGSIALARAAQAVAAVNGRPFVTADDVKDLLPSVLGHRVMLTPEAELAGATTSELLERIARTIPVPKRRDEG